MNYRILRNRPKNFVSAFSPALECIEDSVRSLLAHGTRVKLVAIFAATRWEIRAIRRACGVSVEGFGRKTCSVFGESEACHLWLFRTGVGPKNARQTVQRAFSDQTFDLVISTGFACALSDAKVGDILFGSEVVVYPYSSDSPASQTIKLPEHFVEYSRGTGRKAGISCSQGTFVSTSLAVCRANEKYRIRMETGAIGLDMESHALAAGAGDHNVDFLIVRGVSDVVDEDLPMDFNLFSQGGKKWLLGAISCLLRPSCWIALNRLRKQSQSAASHLTRFFQTFFGDPIPINPERIV